MLAFNNPARRRRERDAGQTDEGFESEAVPAANAATDAVGAADAAAAAAAVAAAASHPSSPTSLAAADSICSSRGSEQRKPQQLGTRLGARFSKLITAAARVSTPTSAPCSSSRCSIIVSAWLKGEEGRGSVLGGEDIVGNDRETHMQRAKRWV